MTSSNGWAGPWRPTKKSGRRWAPAGPCSKRCRTNRRAWPTRSRPSSLTRPRPDKHPTPTAVGAFRFVRGLLAGMLETDPDQPDHARLVEAALGDYQQALVIDRLEDICGEPTSDSGAFIRALSGRVTFLPIDQFQPAEQTGGGPAEADRLRRVSSLVRFPESIAAIVGRLLDRTLVVDDLSAAAAARSRLPAGFRFVTADGHLLDQDGRVTAGPVGGGNGGLGGLISRRSELARLQRQIGQLDQRIAAANNSWRRWATRPHTSKKSARGCGRPSMKSTPTGSSSAAAWTTSTARLLSSSGSSRCWRPRPNRSTGSYAMPTRNAKPTSRRRPGSSRTRPRVTVRSASWNRRSRCLCGRSKPHTKR